jgi:signal transduction histidine kinase
MLMVYIGQLNQTSLERGRLIEKLEETKSRLEAARQHEAELAVLRERERLARDLHDSLGHTLVVLSVQLEAIQRLYHVDPDKASAQVEDLKALTRTSMDDLRRSLAGLRTPGLGDRQLRPALQALCVGFGQRTRTEIEFQIGEEVEALRAAMRETLWRAAQEALTNVEKHAQAKRVELTLRCVDQTLVLEVVDDGIGLPQDAENSPGHFGLRGMRERVEGLGGSLILSGGESGTVLEVRLPFFNPVGSLPNVEVG